MNKITYIPADKIPFPFGDREKRQADLRLFHLSKGPTNPRKKISK
jgi:hypothetical protein